MKKIISILACVCLLLSVMIVPIAAAETSATITFDDKAKRKSFSSQQQVWEENGITITNNKASSTSNLGDNANPIRFYAHTSLTIEYPGITKIEVNANTNPYANVWTSSVKGATVAVDDKVATITLAEPVDSFTVEDFSAQTRVHSITVYAAPAAGGCAHEETTATSNGDETHNVVCNSCSETISKADCVDSDKDAACDTCTGYVELPFDPAGKTPAEIVDAAYELASGESFEVNATLTGVITAVNTPYSDQYGNVTVTIAVEGKEDKPIECYRLAGEGADTITVEDTITVTGILTNYNGKIEFAQGCTLDAVVKGDFEIEIPEDPKEIVDAAFALEEGTSLLYEATLEGEIVKIDTAYDETYGNISVTISVEGTDGMKELLCYRMKAAEGEDASALKVGDVIAVTGTIKNYYGTIEYDTGCTFVLVEAYVEETFEGTDPENPIQLAVAQGAPVIPVEIKVPAEGTVFVQAADANGIFHVTNADGTYMLINGMANQATADAEYDLTLCGYEMVNIYNPGEETITLYVFLEAGAGEVVGTWDNPEVLELQENPWMPNFPPSAQAQTELAEGNQGHFYTITATDNGAFAISITAGDADWNNVGYQFNVTNLTTSWQSEFILRAADAEDFYDTVMIPVSAGDELLINAGTYNPENVYSAPAGILNVNINFAAIGSYEYPVVLAETGTYTAEISAGSQGYYYEYVVTEDGAVTVTMNDDSYHFQVNVVPADEEDWGAYIYGEPHTSSDDPAVASETVAVKAGDTVSIMVNTFNPDDPWNAPAGTVNWALAWSEEVEEPAVPGAFTIDDVDAVAGEEFQVVINISENPGIIGATLDVNYDADVLELVSAEAGDLTNASDERDDVVLSNYNFGPIENNPFKITWVDALAEENITTNGVFVTLTFKVKEDAAEGTTEISINADDIFDKDFNDVEFTFDSATVAIAAANNSIPGDVNGDGNINARDYAMLIQYLNEWDVTIDTDAADVNDDGNINARDYAMLIQYLNEWPVELK